VSPTQTGLPDGVRLVVADASVLYSRCLRDYLLYAAEQGLIVPHWSEQILADMTEHLMDNLHVSAERDGEGCGGVAYVRGDAGNR